MRDEPPIDLVTAAQAGDAEAQSSLGRWYVEHGSGAGSIAEAETWFRRAADQGLARAKHNLGVLALKTGQAEAALDWLRAAARDGWIPSVTILAALVEKAGDVGEATEIYEIAATRGNADAQDALGRLALDRGGEEDYATSRYWSELAADQDNPYSHARLGMIYHEGLGVQRDPQKAASWWLSAARLGHDGAQLAIGVAYHMGLGIQADRVESAFWLTMSAAQGNEGAKAYLPDVQAEITKEEEAAVMSRLRDAAEGRA